MSNLLAAVLLLVVLITLSCSTTVGTRVNEADYPYLSHTNRDENFAWRKHTGPDFYVFYGQPKNRRDAGFGFYRGGHPSFNPTDGASRLKGRLGAFDLDWYQTSTPNPARVYRSAVFDYSTRIVKFKNREQEFKFTEKIHVWIYGVDQQEVEELTLRLGGLQLFQEKPKDKVEMR